MVREIEEQHPIPQDISSYQFRLVGDMTLRQFLQVAAGALIALFLYASPLNPFIKWPLILFSVVTGVALAFLPIDDRPLSTWIIAFFRSIYNPTIFVWNINLRKPSYFQPEAQKLAAPALQPKVQAPAPTTPTPITERAEGTIYLSQSESQALNKLEKTEENFLSRVTHLFSMPSMPASSTQKQVKLSPAAEQAEKMSKTLNINLPTDERVKIERQSNQPTQQVPATQPAQIDNITSKVSPTVQGDGALGATNTQFAQSGTGPEPPTYPNIVVGQVVDTKGSMIEGAILEIKDEQGRPVRALKTNKLGYFMIVTSLIDGKYELTCEKEGYVFDPMIFVAEGKIIQPIIIKSKSETPPKQNVN